MGSVKFPKEGAALGLCPCHWAAPHHFSGLRGEAAETQEVTKAQWDKLWGQVGRGPLGGESDTTIKQQHREAFPRAAACRRPWPTSASHQTARPPALAQDRGGFLGTAGASKARELGAHTKLLPSDTRFAERLGRRSILQSPWSDSSGETVISLRFLHHGPYVLTR